MGKVTITLSSPTYAQKAKRLLKVRGITAEIVKLLPENRSGCSYGIKIDEKLLFDAISILRNADIKYSILTEK